MPGEFSGTRNIVRLLCLAASGSVLVMRKTYWQLCAPVVNILEPLMIQLDPSACRTARVLQVAMSDPPSVQVAGGTQRQVHPFVEVVAGLAVAAPDLVGHLRAQEIAGLL